MRETIYILGLEVPSKLGERPPPVGEDVDVAIKVNNLPSIWMTIFPPGDDQPSGGRAGHHLHLWVWP